MELGVGTAAGGYRHCGAKSRSTGWRDSEGTGDCPLGRGVGTGCGVSGSGAPVSRLGEPCMSRSLASENGRKFFDVSGF